MRKYDYPVIYFNEYFRRTPMRLIERQNESLFTLEETDVNNFEYISLIDHENQLKQKDEALKEARDFVLTFKDFVAYHDNKTFENHTSLIEDLGYWLERNKGDV